MAFLSPFGYIRDAQTAGLGVADRFVYDDVVSGEKFEHADLHGSAVAEEDGAVGEAEALLKIRV